MRDKLDLQDLRERANQYTSQSRRIRNRAYIVILGVLIILGWIYLQTKDPIGGLYVTTEGEWGRANSYPAPIDMQVSDDGTIWIQTAQDSTLSYIGRDDWRFVSKENLDTCCFEFDGVFTSYEDKIWAQSGTSLALYDYENLAVVDDYFPVPDIIELAVNAQGVFAIDSSYSLHLGVFERWETLSLPESTASDITPPTLMNMDDVMVLHYDGLWAFDDGRWNKTLDVSANSSIVGHDWGSIWVNDNGVLIQYRVVYDQTLTYTYADIGLKADNPIQHVFIDYRSGNTYFATHDSIYRLQDRKWEFVETLDTQYGIQSIEVLPWGGWVATSSNLALAQSPLAIVYRLISIFFPALLPILLILLFSFARSFPQYRVIRQRTERSHKLITSLLSDMPGEMKTPEALPSERSSKVRLVIGMSMFILAPIALMMLKLPTIAIFPLTIIIAGIVLYLPAVKKAIKFNDKSLSARQARRGFLNYFGITMLLFGAMALAGVIVPGIGSAYLVIGAWFAFVWIRLLYMRRKPRRFIPKSLQMGDYDSALEQAIKSQNKASIGYVQLYAGKYEDAVKNYLEALQDLGNTTVFHHSVFLMNLGSALNDMGKFDEALRFYEASIVLVPENPIPYHGLVTAYNDNQMHPDRALELSQEMMRTIPTGGNPYMIRAEGNAIFPITHALALANAGQFDEVQSYIDQAKSSIDRDYIPGLATFYHIHARIMLVMNQKDKAIALLNKAIQIDPEGSAGQFAKSILDKTVATNSDS